MLKKITLSMATVAAIAAAQTITSVDFKGLTMLSQSSAREIAQIRPGSELDEVAIDEAIKAFYEQGYFKNVWADIYGGRLVFSFEERRAIANVELKGYGTWDDGEKLLKDIHIKRGDIYSDDKIQAAKKEIQEAIRARGYYNSYVSVETSKVGQSGMSVIFDVNKGEKIIIEKVNFIGAKSLDRDELEYDLVNKEHDFMGWLPFRNNGVAQTEQLEYDALRLKDTYMKHGYLDVEVKEPTLRVDLGAYNAELDYQISEGPQYRVGSVAIKHNLKLLDTPELQEELRLVKGKIFNIERMRKDIKKLRLKIGSLGYAYVDIEPELKKNQKENLIDLVYHIKKGSRVKIHDVIISGNSNTKDRVIRRYLYLAPGDFYSESDLKDSKNALGRTGFFEGVEIEKRRISDSEVDLIVKVKETHTGTLSVGAGYGSYEGAMLSMSVSQKNFFGTGIETAAGFEFSKISKSYHLSFNNPKLWDSKYSLGLNLYKNQHDYYNFRHKTLGGTLLLGREFWRYFHFSIGPGYVENDSEFRELEDDRLVKDQRKVYDPRGIFNDKYKKSSLLTALVFDNTDDYYEPREGVIAKLNMEFGKLDGDDYDRLKYKGYTDIVKSTAKLGLFWGLEDWIDYDLILRAKARATVISSDDGYKLPIAEKLFLGGVGNLRGYNRNSLSPESSKNNGYGTGGKKRATFSLEASIPLSKAANMRLAAFYDYGMIGEDSFDEVKRSSAGLVIEWRSAFGPINLIFAKALDKQAGDKTSVFEFTMGTKF